MAPQHVSPLCSKPLDMPAMTIESILVGPRSTLAFLQQGTLVLSRLFIYKIGCSTLFKIVQACSVWLQVVQKFMFTIHVVHICFALFRASSCPFSVVCRPPDFLCSHNHSTPKNKNRCRERAWGFNPETLHLGLEPRASR